jgi:beta-glucosidase
MLGNYYGVNEDVSTVVEGVVGAVSPATKVDFRHGVLLDRPNVDPADWFSGSARAADVTIAVVGISNLLEGEEGASIASPDKGDRIDIALPGNQVEFLRKIRAGAPKLVVVLLGGSPLAIPEVHDLADAVLFAGYPGEEGGRAIADVLFGNAAPSGRLPMTFPRSLAQLPPFDDYRMAGRTYRYMTDEPLYPFGFGLSFGTVSYGSLTLSKRAIAPSESAVARLVLGNPGPAAVDEVVQLYVSRLPPSARVPRAALKAFRRVRLEAGESRIVELAVEPAMLATVDDAGRERVEKGDFKLTVGGASPGPRAVALGAPAAVEAVLTVR